MRTYRVVQCTQHETVGTFCDICEAVLPNEHPEITVENCATAPTTYGSHAFYDVCSPCAEGIVAKMLNKPDKEVK